MFSEKEINEIYNQYKTDMNLSIELPDLLILYKPNQDYNAMIGNITDDFAELFLGKLYLDKKVNKRFLSSILYHEFTHITDRLMYFQDIKNQKKQRNLLFPYTEYHATQIELLKLLELFYNPLKQVDLSTSICYKYQFIKLKEFLEDEKQDFVSTIELLKEEPTIWNVQQVVYKIIYNIGCYSACTKYNIDNSLFINYSIIPYAETEITQLKQMLLEANPSEKLCRDSHALANICAEKIASQFGLEKIDFIETN